jgi:hypothetical protein
VYSTNGQTCKNDRPSLTLSSSTTCPANGDIPWTKGVHSNSRKWWPRSKTVRGGAAQSKRWAIIFTCLTIRAVHIELIEEMSSSSFINALRRITAIRGPIKIFRSDRGTNFIGATDQIGIKSIEIVGTSPCF